MNRFHDDRFGTFARTSRDEPSRSTRCVIEGPFERKPAWRAAVEDCVLLAMAVAFFAGLAFAPAIWSALLGS